MRFLKNHLYLLHQVSFILTLKLVITSVSTSKDIPIHLKILGITRLFLRCFHHESVSLF